MRHSLGLALICALLIPALADDPPPFASERLRGKTSLLPRTADFENLGYKHLEEQSGAAFTEDVRKVLARKADGPWKTFQDDLVSFEYPNEPLLRVTLVEPGEGSAQVVRTVGTNEQNFKRGYRLVVGPRVRYLTIVVHEADHLNDAVCGCAPIAHQQNLVADGTFLQFSYLETGAIKSVEALGAKHRAILAEWTHSGITQEAFVRIGQSLRLRHPSERTREEWMVKVEEDKHPTPHWPPSQSRFHRNLPWMEPGMTPSAVRALLGDPVKSTPQWDFFAEELHLPDGQHWRFTSRVPYREGQLTQFDSERFKAEELDSEPGTLRWAESLFGREEPAIPGLEDEKPRPKPSRAAAKAAAEAFLKRAEERKGEFWSRWCTAMAALFQANLGDPHVLARIEDTFLDLDRDASGALTVLLRAPSQRLAELTLARARLLCASAEKISQDRLDEFPYLTSAASESAKPTAREVVKSALKHKNPKVRRIALQAAQFGYTSEETMDLHLPLLDDPEPVVRRAAADMLVWHAATPRHLPIFQARLEKESDPETKRALQQIVSSIHEKAAKETR